MTDYYKILGVERSASDEDLRIAFRKLALKHHPDRNPGNAEAEKLFREASEAYTILSDPEKRRRHDRGQDAEMSKPYEGAEFEELFRRMSGAFDQWSDLVKPKKTARAKRK